MISPSFLPASVYLIEGGPSTHNLQAAGCAGLICTWLAIEPLGALFHGDKTRMKLGISYALASSFLYIWIMTLLKISLGFFFYRIFATQLKHRIIIIVTVLVPTLLGIIYFAVSASTCGPVAYLFGLRDCPIFPVYRNLARVWGAQNVVSDLVFPILSINVIRKSEMKRMTKIFAGILVCIATFGSVASVIRLAVLAPSTKLSTFTKTIYSAVWTQLEASVGIICANIACLRPLGHVMIDCYQKRWGPQVTWMPRVDHSRTEETISKKTATTVGTISVATLLFRLNSVFSDSVVMDVQHDWRDDRISQGQELQVPAQAVLTQRVSMVVPQKLGDKDIQIHTHSVDGP
ncbi:hypothetical protein BDZ85DRAFT_126453 [Elsinoe ampelina]|uniref:Rhodopsin domain-containing protein n=1 Tax=Elsinoe ampelina TaxID=302913 RepID=A0A6A6G9H7_9PEZI|nr:hypothetical protein BDZ85DRAFT_126453 [Elsinoe ampelina]